MTHRIRKQHKVGVVLATNKPSLTYYTYSKLKKIVLKILTNCSLALGSDIWVYERPSYLNFSLCPQKLKLVSNTLNSKQRLSGKLCEWKL